MSAGPDGLPLPRRRWAAFAIWLSMSVSVIDGAIANVALPTIASSLEVEAADAIWVVNAYQLIIAVLLLPLAALGERLGHRRLYAAGQVVFVAGSLGCALADSLEALVAARVIQGLGAAGIMSMNAALVRATYPQALLGQGIGRNAMVIGIAAAAGPTIASAILSVASWPWLFIVNLPLGLLAIAAGRAALPHSGGHGAPLDWRSALLNILAFGGLILGAERLGAHAGNRGLLLLLLGTLAALCLVARARKQSAPLLPIDLLRAPVLAFSVGTSIVTFAAQTMAFVALPFHLQDALGRTPVESGMLLTPWPLAVAAAALGAGPLSDRYPAGLLCGAGLALMSLGLAALWWLPGTATDAEIIGCMALCGAGFGLFQTPNNRMLIGSAPRRRSAAAGGLLSTARLGGQTIGATTVAVAFHRLGADATAVVLGSAAAAAALAAGLSLLRLRTGAGRTAALPPHG